MPQHPPHRPAALPSDAFPAHFLSPELLLRSTNLKMDAEVIRSLQAFSEKIIADIMNRAALLARHAGRDHIEASDVSTIVEKDFDYSFGARKHLAQGELPTQEHTDRMAELSRQKP